MVIFLYFSFRVYICFLSTEAEDPKSINSHSTVCKTNHQEHYFNNTCIFNSYAHSLVILSMTRLGCADKTHTKVYVYEVLLQLSILNATSKYRSQNTKTSLSPF